VAPRKANDGLNRDAVIERAMTLADVEGLDAVTIRRLGQEFGVTPMALYWHVKNKDELLDAMGDALYADLHVPAADDAPWPERLRAVLEQLVAALRRHPGSLSLAYRRVLTSPAGLAVTEYALALLVEAGFDIRQAAELATSALQTAIMLVSSEPGAEQGVPEAEVGAHLDAKRAALTQLPIERYPNIRAAAEFMLHCDDSDEYYASGIALYIEGVRAMLQLASV
jgi:TetR/AcrR family transcriptional regulator, tetracycline repressor protein